MKIIDNFLDIGTFEKLQSLMLSTSFPWYYNTNVNDENDPEENFQFTHMFYSDAEPTSELYRMMSPVIKKLDAVSLLRIKANLITRTPKIVEHGLHKDAHKIKNFKIALLYMNTNNGYTLFEDGTKIESVANRMAIFKGNILHSGTSCTDKNVRVVINFNYF